MVETLFWGVLLRFVQVLVSAAPTILVGLVVAGIFNRFVGPENLRRWFGDSTRRSLFRAWSIGMLLPVCSLGAIPIAREMRRAGIAGGTVLAFAMTAPLFNPISVLYGLTLSDPLTLFVFCLCSLLIVMVVGMCWDRFCLDIVEAAGFHTTPIAHGWRRIAATGLFAARELAGPSAGYIAIGAAGVGLLSVVLPYGSLQSAAEHEDLWAPLFMSAVAIPVYATPMTVMVQLASMFQHGNSVGAAFALLILGAGVNLGLVAWTLWNYGIRRCLVWFLLLLLVVVGLAYGVDRPLYPEGVDPAGHTHAFDSYCFPFAGAIERPATLAFETLRDGMAPHDRVALCLLLPLAVAGLFLRVFDPSRRLEAWLERSPAGAPRLDVVIPGPVLGAVALGGLVVLSVLGCYLYYPPPEEIFEELRIVNTEVLAATNSQHWDTAAYWIPHYDDWTRKLQVSMYLRGRKLTPYRQARAKALRDELDLLKHEIEDRDIEEARRQARAVNDAYRQMIDAFRTEPSDRRKTQ